MPTPFSSTALAHLQATFLALVLPRVLSHGRVFFRGIKCPHHREDAIQEMIGLDWQWHLRLAEQGKDATLYPTALASYAARAVKSGSRVCNQGRANDVLSPVAQQRHRFAVERLPHISTLGGSPLEEALHDNTVSPVPDQVAFRPDFPSWLLTLNQRNRAMAEDMALGEKTQDLSHKYRVTQGRISQMRRYFEQDWSRFCGDMGCTKHIEVGTRPHAC